ncbi:MAG TPA: multiheme c-type cytochrome [Terriglobales bacterium]|nr:multiheme c-type cytochrome [Terriglobales bacterium]
MPFKFTGPGSCSSGSCHGSVSPKSETRIFQNEFSVWVTQDSHAKAFDTLQSPVSKRMVKLLGLESSATSAPKCLACHALSPPNTLRGRTLEMSDGVSCESCHGPASQWLGPHSIAGGNHAQWVKVGMNDTKDLTQRAETCASCHVGTKDKIVDHEMIAAGHPALVFEMESYSNAMPVHWKLPADAGSSARAWSVGQAIQLREGLRQLARRVRSKQWPEYAELDCFSCHHSLTPANDSWRQAQGYSGRRPGAPAWNASSWQVLKIAAAGNGTGNSLGKDLDQLSVLVSRNDADRDQIATLAERAATSADQLAKQMESRKWSRDDIAQLMRLIVRDGERISEMGTRSAEQAALALQSLNIDYTRSGKQDKELDASISGLFQQLENPSAFQPKRFIAQLKKVGAALAH